MSNPDEERNNILRKIYLRLSDPNVKKELNGAIKKIEEIYGYPIDISLIVGENDPIDMDTFNEDTYDYMMRQDYKELLEKPDDSAMTLDQLIMFLSEEDGDLKVSIDPIYLKKGRNDVYNVLLTTFENKVIIVPKPVEVKKDEKKDSGN